MNSRYRIANRRNCTESKDDVTVYLNESHERDFLNLKPGAYLTYSGVLAESGHGKKSHVLKAGTILYVDNLN